MWSTDSLRAAPAARQVRACCGLSTNSIVWDLPLTELLARKLTQPVSSFARSDHLPANLPLRKRTV